MANAEASVDDITDLYAELGGLFAAQPGLAAAVGGDDALDGFVSLVEQELCMQLDMERNWANLVHSLVANCSQIDGSLNRVQDAVKAAVRAVAGEDCANTAPLDLPPTLETSMDTLIERVDRLGQGRPNPARTGQVRF